MQDYSLLLHYGSLMNLPAWLKKSRRGLEREILKQHSENGVNKEEAAGYIQFITDFFLAIVYSRRAFRDCIFSQVHKLPEGDMQLYQ